MTANLKKPPARRPKEPWLAIRRPLPPSRSRALTALSFLLPLALWCAVSYTPFIWHPDVKLEIGATGTTVYSAGDHVGKDYFPTVADGVREENRLLREARASGENPTGSKRTNLKILRQLTNVAAENSLLEDGGEQDDAALYEVWKKIALGEVKLDAPALTEENLTVVRDNWELLGDNSVTYDYATLTGDPLFRLIPQGRPANPVYLPAPHEVLEAGIREWGREPSGSGSTMGQKLAQSLKTVFFGFLLAAAFAVPLGMLAGTFDFFGRLIQPFTDFFRYMPAPAFATLLVAVLGAHGAPKLALVFIGTFPHLVLMIMKTAQLLEPALLEAAQTLGAGRKQLLSRVVVPGIWPGVYNDLRIALGWAWTWLVIAELVGVKSGLTELIDTMGDRRQFDRVFPVIILIGIIGFTTDQILAFVRGFLFPWTGEDTGRRGPIARGVANFGRWFGSALEDRRRSYASTETAAPSPLSTGLPAEDIPTEEHA